MTHIAPFLFSLVLLFQFLVIHAFSWWSRWLILEPMARICLGKPRATKSRVQKFAQALIQTIFHVLSACCAWRILATQSWLLVPETWSQPGDPTVAPDLKFYYLLYAARYVSDTVSLWFEHGKSDTWAYAVHHVVSVALVLGSIMAGYIRIGCVIMFFMDWVDPFLLTAKMCRYLSSNPHDGYQFVANRLFEVFGILFFLTRNVLLIYVVWICVRDFPQGARTLKGLCVVLVMVQVFWLVSILQTARIQYTNKGNVDDFRSDVDETEYEHEQDDVLQQTGGIVARKKKRKKHKKH